MADQPDTHGLNIAAASNRGEDPGGTGGQSGGGTVAGAGQPAGGTLQGPDGQAPDPVRDPSAAPPRDSAAAITGDEIAGEAAALGSADGALSDLAAGTGTRQGTTPSGAETVGVGAGRGEPGAGTPGDTGDLGGGDPMGQARAGSDRVGGSGGA